MKTVFILPDLFAGEGGIARIMRLYIRAIAEGEGLQRISYVALLDKGDTLARAREQLGSSLVENCNCSRNKLKFIWHAVRMALGADRVICGHLHQLMLARIAKFFRPSLRYFLVAHGIEVWRPYSGMERSALLGATKVLCVSEYTRRQMLRFEPRLDAAKLIVMPNTFDPRLDEEGRRSATGSGSANGPRILVVSRLVSADPYKGVDLMIESMAEIAREFPSARLRIVGGGDDLPRLIALANSCGVAGRVTFMGLVSDAQLRQEYARCDVFALPSRKEGFGIVYLEAMTHGKPCIAARAGGAPEVVGDWDETQSFKNEFIGSTEVGALVEYGNIDQIAAAVADLVRHPRDPVKIRNRALEFGFCAFAPRLRSELEPN